MSEWLERAPLNPQVLGSIPARSSKVATQPCESRAQHSALATRLAISPGGVPWPKTCTATCARHLCQAHLRPAPLPSTFAKRLNEGPSPRAFAKSLDEGPSLAKGLRCAPPLGRAALCPARHSSLQNGATPWPSGWSVHLLIRRSWVQSPPAALKLLRSRARAVLSTVPWPRDSPFRLAVCLGQRHAQPPAPGTSAKHTCARHLCQAPSRSALTKGLRHALSRKALTKGLRWRRAFAARLRWEELLFVPYVIPAIRLSLLLGRVVGACAS